MTKLILDILFIILAVVVLYKLSDFLFELILYRIDIDEWKHPIDWLKFRQWQNRKKIK